MLPVPGRVVAAGGALTLFLAAAPLFGLKGVNVIPQP
jgi:hypothetical protein